MPYDFRAAATRVAATAQYSSTRHGGADFRNCLPRTLKAKDTYSITPWWRRGVICRPERDPGGATRCLYEIDGSSMESQLTSLHLSRSQSSYEDALEDYNDAPRTAETPTKPPTQDIISRNCISAWGCVSGNTKLADAYSDDVMGNKNSFVREAAMS